MNDSAALNQKFGITGHLSFHETDGMMVAEIDNLHAKATICLQGAHLMNWTPHGQPSVIWMSPAAQLAPGKSIRGGVPVCWPWFGPHATQASFPGHGFARTVLWEVIATKALADNGTWIALRLLPTDATRAQWPHACEVVLQIAVGASLDMDLGTLNRDAQPITIGDALHTYFAVSDIGEVLVHGLEGTTYIDKVDGGSQKRQIGPVAITEEVDRIYRNTTADCVIEDPAWQRRIRIAKRGSHSTVVWNPWIAKAEKMGDLGENGHRKMLCVESTNAADDVVTLAPNQEHHLWVRYTVEAKN